VVGGGTGAADLLHQGRQQSDKLARCARKFLLTLRPDERAAFLEVYPDLAPGGCLSESSAAGQSGDALGECGSGEARHTAGSRPPAREWDSWELAAVVAESPIGWRDALVQRAKALIKYEPARSLATILDVARGRDRPEDTNQAMERVFGRLRGNKPPSDVHYQEAKQKLAARARRAG